MRDTPAHHCFFPRPISSAVRSMFEAMEPGPHRSADVPPPSSAWRSGKNNRRHRQRSSPFARLEVCRSWSFPIRLRPSPPQSFPLLNSERKLTSALMQPPARSSLTLTLDSRRSSAGESPDLIDGRHRRIAGERRHECSMGPSQLDRLLGRLAFEKAIDEPRCKTISSADTVQYVQLTGWRI